MNKKTSVKDPDFDEEIPEEKKKGMILPDLAKRIDFYHARIYNK